MNQLKSRNAGVGSQSGYVASLIEKDILNNSLPPKSFLKSVRDLAEIHGVSNAVICSAIDILEQKNLIIRMPRKGYIVKEKASQEGMLDVLLFALDREPGRSAFITQMLHLPQTPGINARINFTIRLACSQSERSTGRLKEELLRLEKFGYPDCVVIIPIYFTRKEMEICMKLPYPVIFLGDFNEGAYPDLIYRQVTPVADIASFVAKYAREKGYRHVINMIPEFSSQTASEEKEKQIFREEMEKAGIRCSELLIPGKNWNEASILAPYIMAREKEQIQAADLIFSRWMPFPEMDFPHPELLNGFADPGKGIPWLRIDYTPLFKELVMEIRNCRKTLTESIIRKVPVSCIGIDSVPKGIEII